MKISGTRLDTLQTFSLVVGAPTLLSDTEAWTLSRAITSSGRAFYEGGQKMSKNEDITKELGVESIKQKLLTEEKTENCT